MSKHFQMRWLGTAERLVGFALLSLLCGIAQESRPGKTVLVLPFENASSAPHLEWIGESFPEILTQSMASASLYTVSRDDRLYAFDRLGEARGLLQAITENQATPASLPLERIKSNNYDEASFRQLAMEIGNAHEQRLAGRGSATYARYHTEHGRELLAKGFMSEAAREFRQAINLDPSNAAAHSGLAHALEALNDANSAVRTEAGLAIGIKPSAEAYVVLGELDLRERNPRLASESADKALALEPGNTAALALKQAIAAQPAMATQQQSRQ